MATGLTRLEFALEYDNGFLEPDDQILYWREYNPNAGYENEAKSLILNIKKKPTEPANILYYKNRDIEKVSRFFRTLNFDPFTVVPVPPSKDSSHAEYDDRLVRILKTANVSDIRELVVATSSTEASHQSGSRLGPSELKAVWTVDRKLLLPKPTKILIFDDVLTRGAHFRAMVEMLQPIFPKAEFGGLFIARTVRRPIDLDLSEST